MFLHKHSKATVDKMWKENKGRVHGGDKEDR